MVNCSKKIQCVWNENDMQTSIRPPARMELDTCCKAVSGASLLPSKKVEVWLGHEVKE